MDIEPFYSQNRNCITFTKKTFLSGSERRDPKRKKRSQGREGRREERESWRYGERGRGGEIDRDRDRQTDRKDVKTELLVQNRLDLSKM